jgi:hypothetical protein
VTIRASVTDLLLEASRRLDEGESHGLDEGEPHEL